MRVILSDGSTWPEPGAALGWTLRYGEPTREQLLEAAGVVSAYEALVYDSTRVKRDLVCREMRINRSHHTDFVPSSVAAQLLTAACEEGRRTIVAAERLMWKCQEARGALQEDR